MPRRRASASAAYPFVKWAGGKTQLLPQFARLYPPREAFARFVEPFVGGGAVFFDVQERLGPKPALLSDCNAELVGAYRAVRDDVEGVIAQLRRHRARHSAEHFYATRALQPEALATPAARAARLIYLNKTCFNGLYRVNSRGQFNVPLGRYKAPLILDEEGLRRASARLRGVEVQVGHFREALGQARPGDFVYLDPPYHPVSRTANFTSYTEGSFDEADQEELAALYAKLAEQGCLVMLSNSDTPFVRRLYRRFRPQRLLARRSINSRSSRRGPVHELVVLSYRPRAVQPWCA